MSRSEVPEKMISIRWDPHGDHEVTSVDVLVAVAGGEPTRVGTTTDTGVLTLPRPLAPGAYQVVVRRHNDWGAIVERFRDVVLP